MFSAYCGSFQTQHVDCWSCSLSDHHNKLCVTRAGRVLHHCSYDSVNVIADRSPNNPLTCSDAPNETKPKSCCDRIDAHRDDENRLFGVDRPAAETGGTARHTGPEQRSMQKAVEHFPKSVIADASTAFSVYRAASGTSTSTYG